MIESNPEGILGGLGAACLSGAVLHTFLTHKFKKISLKFREGSVGENLFHLLAEVEVVFGFWAILFLSLMFLVTGKLTTLDYINTRNFSEPVFVFVIMAICSTKPILHTAEIFMDGISRILPIKSEVARLLFCYLAFGPLLGSLITEPAAMTLSAILVYNLLKAIDLDRLTKHIILAVLFVNISVGGTLTDFAAPPVLMVAKKFEWDLVFMLTHFGWKAFFTVALNALGVIMYLSRVHPSALTLLADKKDRLNISNLNNIHQMTGHVPFWILLIHLVFLIFAIAAAHYTTILIMVFLLFLGVWKVTLEYQKGIRIVESLLVAFFLGGIIILGGFQEWWLRPALEGLTPFQLYVTSVSLTAVTDNAALTYLGSLVEGLTPALKYCLVSGSVVGGGLTLMANAPNPAGYGILRPWFGAEGVSPGLLFKCALIPTLIAGVLFFLR